MKYKAATKRTGTGRARAFHMAPPTMDMAIRTQLAHVTPQTIGRGAAGYIEYLAKSPDLGARLDIQPPLRQLRREQL
jgi:hypothetical protein